MNKPWLYSLEYYVSIGCNNCCVGCSHGAPIKSGLIDVEIFRRDVLRMKEILDVHRFALSGGEPLLHPQIEELLDIAKYSGLSKEVMILTNGLLLEKQPKSFWENLDVLRISRYPGQLTDKQINKYKKCAKLYGAEFMCLEIKEFYKTLEKDLSNAKETIKKFEKCLYYSKCSAIWNGWYYPCSQAFFCPELMGLDPFIDGIKIDSLSVEKLVESIERRYPITSCLKCSYGQMRPWKQTTRNNWIEDSTRDAI